MSRKNSIVLVAFGGIVIFMLYLPLLLVLVFSFNSAPRGMLWESFSLKWYQSVWSDSSMVSSLKNTLTIAVATGGISLLGGLTLGYSVGTARGRTFSLALPLLFIPAVLPDLVLALAQSLLYSLAGLPKGLLTIVLSQATFGIAYVALFVTIRVKSIPYEGYALAAQTLGASPARILLDHFLPLTFPAAMAGVAVVLALSAQDFIYAFFCGGPDSTTLSVRIYGMVKFGVNSSVNVVYVFLAALAVLAYWISEVMMTQQRSRR